MKNKLNSKVAVITGGSSGIGLSISNALFAKGVRVYNISRKDCKEPCFAGDYNADVNEGDKIHSFLNEIEEKEGKIDIFINNAGFGIGGAVENASGENIYKQIDTNLSAVINLSRIAIKFLKKTNGNLINISSVGGVIPLPYQASYSATKAGVDVFSRALANEVKGQVKVTVILPGDTKTGFTKARVIENNGEDSEKIQKSIKKFEMDEEKGKSPDTVAKCVIKVLNKKRPPLRKTVGAEYKLIVFLPRLVSCKLANAIVRKLYCKK